MRAMKCCQFSPESRDHASGDAQKMAVIWEVPSKHLNILVKLCFGKDIIKDVQGQTQYDSSTKNWIETTANKIESLFVNFFYYNILQNLKFSEMADGTAFLQYFSWNTIF